ncbi:hypothetical protein [Kribbella sp. NPDC050459]|uniref:hypothetical protein n=1 Tax=Kribbella sp. NPDC050459 TaxID=3155785 RepID=UPI0033F328D2
MTTWQDVCALAERLPDARLSEAHEGSPAWFAGRHQFARLRWDDAGRELLQVWTGDMTTQAALAERRDVFRSSTPSSTGLRAGATSTGSICARPPSCYWTRTRSAADRSAGRPSIRRSSCRRQASGR